MTNLRYLRKKYRIPLAELSASLGISGQQISRMELLDRPITNAVEQQYRYGMLLLIAHRCVELKQLLDEFEAVEHRLFEEDNP